MPDANEIHGRYKQQARWTSYARQFLLQLTSTESKNPRVLEVGSGTGAILGDIEFDHARLYGLDIQHRSLVFSQTHLSQDTILCTGDGAALPYGENTFDIAYCHFLLLWVDTPLLVLEEFARVLKPGGTLMCFAEPDYGGRIDYPPVLGELGALQIKSLVRQGADPYLGRKLSSLVGQVSGLEIHRTGIIGQDIPHPANDNPGFWEEEWRILESDLSNLLKVEELQSYKHAYKDAIRSGTQVLFIPTFYLSANKK